LLAPLVSAKSLISRGIRNNNPGNITKTNIQWQGEVPCQDVRFECFESPEKGIRAIVKNLDSYILKHKLTTLDGIISRWSPPNENNTEKLKRNITRNLTRAGVGSFSVHNRHHITLLIREFIRYENGYVPYTDLFILGVINDTSRITNNGGEYSTRWDNEYLVSVNRVEETDSPSSIRCNEGERETTTASSKGQKLTVHTKSYSDLIRTSYHRLTETSRFMGHTCNLWLDRVAEWVLILYGRKGYSPMASDADRGNTPDTSGHTPRKCYYRPLLWWKPCF